jgi:hypothetical protein
MLYFSIENGFQLKPTNDSYQFDIDSHNFTILSIYNYDKPIQLKIVSNDIDFKSLYESYFNQFHTSINYQINHSSGNLDNYYIQEIKVYDPSHPYLNIYTLYKFKYIYPMESIIIKN